MRRAASVSRQAIADYKSVRHLLNKDYYPLFPQTTDTSQWVGWEFYDPDAGEGFLTVLRPVESATASSTILFGGIESSAMYELSRIDGSQARQVAGSAVAQGAVNLAGTRRFRGVAFLCRPAIRLPAIMAASLTTRLNYPPTKTRFRWRSFATL